MDEINKKLEILLNRTRNLEKLEVTVNQINCRLIDLEKKVQDDFKNLATRVETVETSIKFTDSQYDQQKKTTDNLVKQESDLKNEIKDLNVGMRRLENELEQEKASRNEDAQHARSSTHVKLCGLPMQDGEDEYDQRSSDNPVTRALVVKVAGVADMRDFDSDQIDVCHRLGSDENSPIIIRFKHKCERMAFFHQRKNLANVTKSELGLVPRDPAKVAEMASARGARGGGRGGRGRGGGRGGGARGGDNREERGDGIFMQDSLTHYSSQILSLVKDATSKLNFKYAGYVFNGQIRAKKGDTDKFIRFRCVSDISKLLRPVSDITQR